jgi:hypothetical protein
MLNEHNKANQNLSQLHLLIFYCLIILVYLPLRIVLSHLYVASVTEKNSPFHCLISMVSFTVTNIIFLNNSNKCNQMHSRNNLYGNQSIDLRNRKIVFQISLLSTVTIFAIGSAQLLMQCVSVAVSLREQ